MYSNIFIKITLETTVILTATLISQSTKTFLASEFCQPLMPFLK